MFRVIKTEGAARRGEFTCPHGVVPTERCRHIRSIPSQLS